MPNNPLYPEMLEQAWIRHAMEVTRVGNPRLAVERLAAAAGSLSDAFTTGRDPSFAGYAANRQALAAYGLFFFPRAYARTLLTLEEAFRRGRAMSGRSAYRVVDLGAGTGAAGLAAAQALSAREPEAAIELHLVDAADHGTELARMAFAAGQHLWRRVRLHTVAADARTHAVAPGADLILCSFAINEWMEAQPDFSLEEWTARLLRSLRPGGWLVLLEPSLRFSVERMERLRDRMAASGTARILAPCPHHRTCAMLAEKRGWCHEVRTWRTPESLRWINRNLQRDVHLLKYAMLVLENGPPPDVPETWTRLVSPLRKEKGKYVFHGCGPDGQVRTCEWLTRHLTPEQKDASEALERGDQVVWHADQVLGDGTTERSAGPPVKD